MQAVILAGGQGTRLRPLTLSRPKPVVPLLNRPLIAYQLALLREHGVDDVALACSYRVDDVRGVLERQDDLGVAVRYAVEREPLGTGGGLVNALGPGSGSLFVLNGDILTDVDLSAMRRFHASRRARLTVWLTRVPDPRPYGLVETDADGRIRRFEEKPPGGDAARAATINAGVYLLDSTVMERFAPARQLSLERDVFPALVAEGVPCFGWLEPAYWRDVGEPAAYRAAQIDLLEGRITSPLRPPGVLREGTWFAGGGSAAPDARVEPPSVVGADVELHARAHVGPRAVIGERSRIGADARVEDAVLWERVEVGAGAVLRGCVVGADARIGPRAEIGPDIVLESGAVVPEHARLAREGAC